MKEDTADQSSIPALCRRQVVVDKGFKTAGKTEIEELGHKAFLKKIVFIQVLFLLDVQVNFWVK